MIDLETLRELEQAIGREAIERILNVFLEELDQQLSQIVTCTQAGQTNRVEDIAHALKSTSATFGATDLTRLALDIEITARNEDVDGLEPLIASLQVCIQKTRPLYRSYTD